MDLYYRLALDMQTGRTILYKSVQCAEIMFARWLTFISCLSVIVTPPQQPPPIQGQGRWYIMLLVGYSQEGCQFSTD